VEKPVEDTRLRVLPHVIAGYYNVAGILSSTGTIFEWYRHISGQAASSYDEMLAAIAGVPATRHIPWFFPSLHRGAAWEFSRGMFIELGATHASAEMGRAVVEAIGYAVRESVELLEENGCEIAELRACGGQAKNDIWNQMKADITGKPLIVGAVEDAELLGNACCCMVGVGRYSRLDEASRALYREAKGFEPVAAETTRYDERYEKYQEAYRHFRQARADCTALS
jgi:xylulokinase